MTENLRRYHFDLVCPRCGKHSETVTENREPPPHVNCGDCLMEDVVIVEFKILRCAVTYLMMLALLVSTDARAQEQRTVYGPDGKVQSQILPSMDGKSSTIYGADGRVQGRTSTGSDGTVTVYGSNGNRAGSISPPSGGGRSR